MDKRKQTDKLKETYIEKSKIAMPAAIETGRRKENSMPIEDFPKNEKCPVLKISDDYSDQMKYKAPPPYSLEFYFHDDFRKHLREVILQRVPTLTDVNEYLVEYFGASYLKRDNSRSIYFFHYTYDQRTEIMRKIEAKHGSIFIVGPTFNGRRILLEVKKQFCKEKWLSDNIMDLPLKSKIGMVLIQKLITGCLNQEEMKLCKFVTVLHSKYHSKNTS